MIKVFTTFSGYDSQCLALRYAGIPFELIGWSEIDKHAIKAHDALFPEYADRNYGDVTAIDWSTVPDFDLLTWSSPCQDISNAGMQRGLEKGSGTRSSLLWEVEKAIEAKHPKYILMENVNALVGKKFKADFEAWLETLRSYGYQNFWRVLNAKDYGVPQNRKRVFVVSILGEHQPYYFPDAKQLEKRLKDVLESNVDEKYYLRQELVESMKAHCERKQAEGCGFKFEPTEGNGAANAITTNYGGRNTDCFIKVIPINTNEDGTARTICAGYDKEGAYNILGISQQTNAVAETVCLNSKVDGKQPSLEHRVYSTDGISTAVTTSFKPSIGVSVHPCSRHLEFKGESSIKTDAAPALRSTDYKCPHTVWQTDFRIRKLTERECFRLMGVRDEDIDKIKAAGISKTQMYKMAGNSIVCDVLVAIFDRLLVHTEPNRGTQLRIF